MPGRHTTDRQVARYMHARQTGHTQPQSADAASISERTGRSLDRHGRAARPPREYRTRADPFSAVWTDEIEPLLVRDAQLQAAGGHAVC